MAYVEAISNGGSGTTAARSNAIRSDYFARNRVVVAVNGTQHPVITEDLRIRSTTGSEPSTADLALKGGSGAVPDRGQRVIIGHGTLDNRLFSGRIIRAARTVARHVESKPHYALEAADLVADLARAYPATGFSAQSVSATSIVRGLLASATPSTTSMGFAATYVQLDLPTLATFVSPPSESVVDAFDRLAAAIGATWYSDVRQQLHFYTSTDPHTRPAINTLTPDVVTYMHLTRVTEFPRVFSRVVGVGATMETTEDAWSDDTRLPVSDVYAITDREFNDDQLHLKRTSATSAVTVDGIVRTLTYARPESNPHYAEAIEAPSPISITANSYWVGRMVSQLPESSFWSLMVDRKWWSTLGNTYRVESLTTVSVSANSIYRDIFVPAVGPGAPPPTAIGAVPAGTRITAPKFELVVTADPGPRRVLPRGTPIRTYYAVASASANNAIQSLTGSPVFGTATDVVDLPSAGPADLIKACAARLAEGDPQNWQTLTLETRDPLVEPGRTVYVSLPSPGEPGGPTIAGTFTVLDVRIEGFDRLADSKGPIRTVTLGVWKRPTLFNALKV